MQLRAGTEVCGHGTSTVWIMSRSHGLVPGPALGVQDGLSMTPGTVLSEAVKGQNVLTPQGCLKNTLRE